MNSFRCSACSLLNFDTASACKRCGMPFEQPAEPTARQDQYGPTPPYPPPAEGNSYFWDQPDYQPHYVPPRPASPAPSGAVKLVGGVVFLAVALLVGFVAMPKLLKRKQPSFANLSWRDYTPADGSYSISLPSKPKETKVSQPTALGPIQVNVALADLERNFGCLVMHAEYPMSNKVSEEEMYEVMLKNFASAESSHLGPDARKLITHDGRKGIEAEFQPADLAKLDAKARARIFWVPPRLFLVMAAGPETPEFAAVSNRCMDSFKFSPGQ